jgi:hypothetical protein
LRCNRADANRSSTCHCDCVGDSYAGFDDQIDRGSFDSLGNGGWREGLGGCCGGSGYGSGGMGCEGLLQWQWSLLWRNGRLVMKFLDLQNRKIKREWGTSCTFLDIFHKSTARMFYIPEYTVYHQLLMESLPPGKSTEKHWIRINTIQYQGATFVETIP